MTIYGTFKQLNLINMPNSTKREDQMNPSPEIPKKLKKNWLFSQHQIVGDENRNRSNSFTCYIYV
jgi:hypothetical protein